MGDKDGVPVWAADTLAFKGAGAKLKVKNRARQERTLMFNLARVHLQKSGSKVETERRA